MHAPSESASASATQSRGAEANRANAQKSAGLKFETGTGRSSRKATGNGMLAQSAALVEQPTQELEDVLNKYRSEFLPSSTHEEMLVRELAVSDWRLTHIARIEAGLLSYEMNSAYSDILNMGKPPRSPKQFPVACPKCGDVHADEAIEEPEPPQLSEAGEDVRTVVMGAAWANNPAAFALLVRSQNQARRDYFRALKQLELVRTGKAGYLPEKPPSRIGRPIRPEAQVAPNQTNPPMGSCKTATASSSGQTNPNAAAFIPKFHNSTAPFIASSEQWRQIFGVPNGNVDITKRE